MKKEECKYCYYEGIEKCFLYNKKFEEIKNCNDYLLDPYIEHPPVGEVCKNCHYYQSNQCLGNELAKENCIWEK